MKYEEKKFFGMKIDLEEGMGSPYRPDNFIPILFLKYLPTRLGFGPIRLCSSD